MIRTKKAIPIAMKNAQDFVGVDEINGGILYTNDKMLYTYIRVRAMGDSLYTKQEREQRYERLMQALELETEVWQLVSIPRVVNTGALISNLLALKQEADSDARLSLLDGEIDAVRAMAADGVKEPMIVIKLWKPENAKNEAALHKRAEEMTNRLCKLHGMEAHRLTDPEIAFLCKQFAELGVPQEDGDDTGELPVMTGAARKHADVELLNEITPVGGISFDMKRVMLGGTVGRVFAVSGYPDDLPHGWLSEIMNNAEAVTCITFDPANPYQLGEALSRSIRRTSVDAMTERDVRKSKAKARQATDADAMLDELDARGETIGQCCIVTMPFSDSGEGLEKVCERTSALFSARRIRVKSLGGMQAEGLKMVMPYHPPQPVITDAMTRLMPLYTFCGSSAMTVNAYQDKTGFYFARTSTGNVVSLDFWHRGLGRTSSNYFALGKSGAGKSTTLKHIIQIEFMRGTKILIIDPEGEYREITQHLGGDVFYAGGGDAKINLLQVRPAPDDDEDEAGGDRLYQDVARKGNVLAMHLKNCDTIFRSYLPEASEIEFSLLEKSLIELYGTFGIDWSSECRNIPAERFPIIEDLYSYIKQQADETHNDAMETLCSRLYSAARGSDKFVFNGHSNIDINKQILCFDTKSLQSQSDNVKRAQYMNILGLAWEITSADRGEKVMLLADEGHIMIDPKLPQSLMMIRNFGKRCRKINGSLGFATQSVVDLLHESVRQYGQSVLDNSTYKFFMGADGMNLKEIAGLYDMTEPQQSILRAGNQGEALAMLGATMLHLHFKLPQYKLDNMGKGGGL